MNILNKNISKNQINKNRLPYFDMAKGFGAVLVLLGHLQGDEFFKLSPYVLPMCEWIFSFHMVLFFVVSGMLLYHKNDIEKDFGELAKKRFKGIMIPYFWFSAFYISVVVYALIFKTVMPATLFVNLWYILSTYGMNVLWFLPALFFGELLFIFIMQKFKDKRVSVAVIVGLGVAGFVLSYVMTRFSYDTELAKRFHEFATALVRPLVVSFFILIGYYGQKLIVKLFDQKNNKLLQIIAGLALMFFAALFVKVNHGVDFRSLVFKNVFFYLLCSVLSSFGLVLICRGIPTINLIKFFGVNSLIFMGVHNNKTVLFYAMNFAMYINQYVTRAKGYIYYAIVVAVILIYVTLMTVLINKFVPFIVGKPFQNPFNKVDKKDRN